MSIDHTCLQLLADTISHSTNLQLLQFSLGKQQHLEKDSLAGIFKALSRCESLMVLELCLSADVGLPPRLEEFGSALSRLEQLKTLKMVLK